MRRMMNFVTIPPSSLSFFSHSALTASVASASRPRMMAFSKFLRKSFLEPRKLGFAKFKSEKYSERSFCTTLLGTVMMITVTKTTYLNRCPGKNDSPLDVEAIESLEGLRLYLTVSTQYWR